MATDDTLSALVKVSNQLESLQQQVAALAESASRERIAAAKNAPPGSGFRGPSPPLKRGLSIDAASSEDETAYLRPSHYTHAPASRLDGLEAQAWSETPIIDALKSEQFAGLLHLSFMLLLFSFAYLTVRSVRDKGMQLTLADFTCDALHRDMWDAGVLIGLCYAWSFAYFATLFFWTRKRISWHTVTYIYVALQCGLLLGPVLFIYSTRLAPMPSAAVLMVALVLGLKGHSYIFTNLAIYREHIGRYGALPGQPQLLDDATGSDSRRRKSARRVAGDPAGADTTEDEEGADSAVASGVVAKAAALRRKGKSARKSGAQRADAEPEGEGGAGKGGSSGASSGASTPAGGATELGAMSPRTVFLRAQGAHSAGGKEGDAAPPPALGLGEATKAAGAESFGPGAVRSAPGEGFVDAGTGEPADAAAVRQALSGAALSPAERRQMVKAWPHNVTVKDFAYFVAAPTLVYEPKFPRTRRRRWGYILRKSLEAIACCALQYLIMRQFMLPVLQNPSQPRNDGVMAHIGALCFDMMKLAVPSLVVWLCGFYAIFHCWLNILAELLRFADRTFFLAWWNSTTIDEFWRKWNIPVHEWCLRHIFVDCQQYFGLNKSVAVLATFFFSAVAHELVFSVAFKTFRPWFFLGMVVQIPMMYMGKGMKHRRRGNYLVWWSLFSGQPLLEMLYFREWFGSHQSFFCVTEVPPVVAAITRVVGAVEAINGTAITAALTSSINSTAITAAFVSAAAAVSGGHANATATATPLV